MLPFPLYYHSKNGLNNDILNRPKVSHYYKPKSSVVRNRVNIKNIECNNEEFLSQYFSYLESLKKYSENNDETPKAKERLKKKYGKMLKKLKDVCFCK